MTISLKTFIDDGVAAQNKIAKASMIPAPNDFLSREARYQLILNNLFHATEELIEARREVARRPWKKDEIGCLDSEEKRLAFAEELCDVLLFIRATLAYAQISGQTFCDIMLNKISYNETRPDHKMSDV